MSRLRLTHEVGNRLLNAEPGKLAQGGVSLMHMEGVAAPLVEGGPVCLACRLVPEPHNQQTCDLFIGEVTAAWAGARRGLARPLIAARAGPAWPAGRRRS